MNIIIAGAGKVGMTIAGHLVNESHNITVVDVSQATLNRVSNQMDVMCVKGNGSSRSVLLEAGAKGADVVIAATNSDENNLLCCHCAHRLGVPFTVARVRNTDYSADVETLKADLGISMLINPELATAKEISRLLRFPNVANIDTFVRGQVEIVALTVQSGDFWAGRSIASLSSKIQDLAMLLCAVERGVESCGLCPDYPCQTVEQMIPAGAPHRLRLDGIRGSAGEAL